MSERVVIGGLGRAFGLEALMGMATECLLQVLRVDDWKQAMGLLERAREIVDEALELKRGGMVSAAVRRIVADAQAEEQVDSQAENKAQEEGGDKRSPGVTWEDGPGDPPEENMVWDKGLKCWLYVPQARPAGSMLPGVPGPVVVKRAAGQGKKGAGGGAVGEGKKTVKQGNGKQGNGKRAKEPGSLEGTGQRYCPECSEVKGATGFRRHGTMCLKCERKAAPPRKATLAGTEG